jgi:DNA-binding HxlR family transcriptional regulator
MLPPDPTSPPRESCPADSREILGHLGDKWSLEVVSLLRTGPMRFNELRRGVEGISQRMLTLTLRGLERDGLVNRTITPTRPPRVDYELSPLGITLTEPLSALMNWVVSNREAVEQARQQFDQRQEME